MLLLAQRARHWAVHGDDFVIAGLGTIWTLYEQPQPEAGDVR